MSNSQQGSSGILIVLKLFAVLAIITVGGLAILFVMDVIPKDVFKQDVIKYVTAIGIVAAVSSAVALLVRSR